MQGASRETLSASLLHVKAYAAQVRGRRHVSQGAERIPCHVDRLGHCQLLEAHDHSGQGRSGPDIDAYDRCLSKCRPIVGYPAHTEDMPACSWRRNLVRRKEVGVAAEPATKPWI